MPEEIQPNFFQNKSGLTEDDVKRAVEKAKEEIKIDIETLARHLDQTIKRIDKNETETTKKEKEILTLLLTHKHQAYDRTQELPTTEKTSTSKSVYVLPGSGLTNGTVSQTSAIPDLTFPDGVTSYWNTAVMVPAGAVGIDSIKVYYRRQSTGNLFLRFFSAKWDMDNLGSVKVLDETDVFTAYAGGANNGSLGAIVVPPGAYNGLGVINEGDLVGVYMIRDGGGVNDTYDANWLVVAIQYNFV